MISKYRERKILEMLKVHKELMLEMKEKNAQMRNLKIWI